MSQRPPAGPFGPVIDLLSSTELFRDLSPEELRELAAESRRQRATAGQVLVDVGGPTSTCWIIRSGTVEVSGPGGSSARGRPQLVGEAGLTTEGASPVRALALDAVELVAIPVEAVKRALPESVLTSRLRAASAGVPSGETEAGPEGSPDEDPAWRVSRAMQRALLPRNAPRVPGYDIAAGTTAEDHGRGNSVWDAIPLADGGTALAVFDVRSDGLPPALLLGMARCGLRAAAGVGGPVADLLRRANAAMASVLGHVSDQFVECMLVVPREDGVEWATAGRVPAGMLGRAGTLDVLTSHGPPLGMMDGFGYGSETVPMGAGDALLVLSEGAQGLFRGAADLVAQVQEKTAGEVVSTVHKGLRKAGGAEPPEVSVLYLRRH